MPRPRLPRTLRSRLVAVLALLLVVGFAAAALVTVAVVRHVLVDRLDAQLQAAGDRFATSLEHNDQDADNGGGRYRRVEGQAAGTLGARLLNGRVTNAAIVGDHDTADHVPAAAAAVLGRLTASATPRSIRLPDLGTYRVIVTPGHDGDLQVTGLPAEPVEHTIDTLVWLEIIVFASTLVLVALTSAGLVRLMLRPLARMADTAAEVSELPLHTGGVAVPQRVTTGSAGSEVDALASAFNSMLEQVESALVGRDRSDAQLRRFLADASHELRTPVAVVRSHAELARRSADRDQVDHSLDRIIAQAGRMGSLVEELLMLARLDSGRPLAREPVDLTRVVLDAVDDVRATASGHIWHLRLPPEPIRLVGDAHALGQVVANLLANAAVHTPDGTTVTVAADRGPDDRTRLVVTDDGPGMSDELATHAFDRFVRGDRARSLARGSSGLGLPIAAAIVRAHGGEISLESSSTGTAVTVVLPSGGVDDDVTDEVDAPTPLDAVRN